MESSRIFILARLCVAITFLAHLLVLLISGADAASTPISQLSRGTAGWLHSVGLGALGLAWLLIASQFWRRERSWLWRSGCLLLMAAAPVVLFVAYYFATASDGRLLAADANDPLSVLASILGVAMGALQPGLRRQNPGIARLNLAILVLWIALVPVIPFIPEGGLGAYERTVGALMLIWTVALTAIGDSGSEG